MCWCVSVCVGLENAIKAMHKIRQRKKTHTYTLTKKRTSEENWVKQQRDDSNNRQGEFSNFKYLVFRQGLLFPRLITEAYFTLKFKCLGLIKYHMILFYSLNKLDSFNKIVLNSPLN